MNTSRQLSLRKESTLKCEISDKIIYTEIQGYHAFSFPIHVVLLSQNLCPVFFMAEINHKSCHKDDDHHHKSDLLWLMNELFFLLVHINGAQDSNWHEKCALWLNVIICHFTLYSAFSSVLQYHQCESSSFLNVHHPFSIGFPARRVNNELY
jgi:hypothetical protein